MGLITFFKQRRCLIDSDGNLTPEEVTHNLQKKIIPNSNSLNKIY